MTRFAPWFALLLSTGGCAVCDPEAVDTICTVVGDGVAGFTGDGGPATRANLYAPQDMAVAANGELWVLDFNNYVIRVVDAEGDIRTVMGSGFLGDSPEPGEPSTPAAEASFNHTSDLVFIDDSLYLAAWHNSRVKRLDLTTMHLENFAGIGTRSLYHGDGGPALDAALDLPSSVAAHPDGGVAIMDQANQVIRHVREDGTIHRLAGLCVVEAYDACAPGQVPTACPGSDKLTCGDPEWECSKACTPGYGGDGGDALQLRMGQPFGQMADPAGRLAFDAEGGLIFADTDNHRIRRIDPNGVVTTIAGTGLAGDGGDGGPAVDASLNRPIDVEVGDDGTIWFADTYNNCIRRIEPDGTLTDAIGRCSSDEAARGFAGDGGSPIDASFDRPYGIELDGDRVFIADSYNHRIRVACL